MDSHEGTKTRRVCKSGVDKYHPCPLTSRRMASLEPHPLNAQIHLSAMAMTGRSAWTITNVSTSWRGRIPAALCCWRGRVTGHLLVAFIIKTLTGEISYLKSRIKQSARKKEIPRHPRLYASVHTTSFSPNPILCL